MSDLSRSGALPAHLNGLLAWIACIGDARPIEEYVAHLADAGFQSVSVEPHDDALAQMVREIQGRLLAFEDSMLNRGRQLEAGQLQSIKRLRTMLER